jgi:hypothetical protein
VINPNSTAVLPSNTPISIYANNVYLRTIYTQTNIPIDAGTYDALKGFFGSNGFSDIASDSITFAILYQAYVDQYNPMQVIENIKGLDGVQLNSLVTEILNYNRFKTSFLGRSAAYQTTPSVTREILS